jgi:hypothetical protein
MYQVWVYDSAEEVWVKVSKDLPTWDEALNFAKNSALKNMSWNVEIHEQDEDGETISRILLQEYQEESN